MRDSGTLSKVLSKSLHFFSFIGVPCADLRCLLCFMWLSGGKTSFSLPFSDGTGAADRNGSTGFSFFTLIGGTVRREFVEGGIV